MARWAKKKTYKNKNLKIDLEKHSYFGIKFKCIIEVLSYRQSRVFSTGGKFHKCLVPSVRLSLRLPDKYSNLSCYCYLFAEELLLLCTYISYYCVNAPSSAVLDFDLLNRAKIIYRSFVHRSTTIAFLEQRKSKENLDSTWFKVFVLKLKKR